MAKKRLASLTSAAARILNPERDRPPSEPVGASVLYDLYSNLGQIRAAMEFKAMAASKVQYYPARKPGPRDDPEPVEDGPALEAFERLRGIQGEFADFVAEFCNHLDIAGEGYLVGWGDGDDGDDGDDEPPPNADFDEWDVISPVEYKKARATGYIRNHESAIRRIRESDFTLRVWRPDPKLRELPNSALRAVRTEAEQYILLRGMISSIAQSRLIMGVLGVPEGLSFPTKANGDPADDFFEVFMEAAEAAVRDHDSAARIVPIFVQGDGEVLQQFTYIDFQRELPEWVPVLMERVLRQIATGLDLPADILLGLADVNHWTAWLSEDSAKLDYVDPLVLLILDSLTRGYLHPYLRAAGVSDPESYLFWRDYSDLIARSVGTADATALYDRNIITSDAVRRTVGFTEADAPETVELGGGGDVIEFPAGPDTVTRGVPGTQTPAAAFGMDTAKDIATRVNAAGILIRSGFDPEAALEAVGLPFIEHLGLLPVTVKDTQQISSNATVEEITATAIPTREDVNRALRQARAAAPVVAAATPSLGQIDHRLFTQISEASQAAVDRALERAGQKIRSHAVGDPRRTPKHPQFAAAIEGVYNGLVGQTLGEGVKEIFQLTDDDLIPESTFNGLGDRVRRILSKGQDETAAAVASLTGVQPERNEDQERSWIDQAVTGLLAGITALALRRLFTPDLEADPAETGEVADTAIPAALVYDTLTIAGGGQPSGEPGAPRGLANGEQTQTWIVEAGYQIRERVWTVGAPALPFEPHQNLRGTRFTEWTDPALATPLTAGWLGVSFMFPGDHRGCQCVAELVVAEADDLLSPLAASG